MEEDNFPKTETNKPALLAKPDSINSEFLYYSSALKTLVPAMTVEYDRHLVLPWIRKLFQPEYHSSQFKEKRNRYLLYLALSLLNDEAYGIFRSVPPIGALPELHELEQEPVLAAEWELDTTWSDTLLGLPNNFQTLRCSVHNSMTECNLNHCLDTILDQEFQFLLYIARPYATLLHSAGDRTRAATWLQILCSIHGNACSSMRGIRNDYMMALLGYLSDMRVVGPFCEYPPWSTLRPLGEAAKSAAESAETRPITDPTNPEANEFLAVQPIPTDGAFCYIAVTGDMIESSFEPD